MLNLHQHQLLLFAVSLLVLALMNACSGDTTPGPIATRGEPGASPTAPVSTAVAASPAPTPRPTATPRPRAGSTPARDPISFSFGAIPDDERAVIRGGIDVARRYLEAAAGLKAVAANVYAYADLAAMQAAIARNPDAPALPVDLISRRLGVTTAESYPGNIFINTGTPVWRAMLTVHRFRTTAHEYFHLVQFSLLGPELSYRVFTTPVSAERSEGPSWLFEGGADWISWQSLEAAGLGSLAAYLESTPPSRDVDLADLESYLEYVLAEEARIALSVAAVDRLLVGRGAADLIGFYRQVGAGIPWRTAFANSFGRTVDQFYSEFEGVNP